MTNQPNTLCTSSTSDAQTAPTLPSSLFPPSSIRFAHVACNVPYLFFCSSQTVTLSLAVARLFGDRPTGHTATRTHNKLPVLTGRMASNAASAAAAAAAKRSAATAAAAASVASTFNTATAGAAASTSSSSALKWAAGGWTLFIAENLILSENRTYLIDQLGDDGYHGLYGTLSTIAMGSVAYGYRYKVRGQGPFSGRAGPAALATSFALQALALGMVSQSAPKLQIPVHLVDGSGSADTATAAAAAPAAKSGGGSQWKVRCPFDFSDSKSQTGVSKGTKQQADQLAGLDRITRHPGLWSFGLLGLGNALLVPSIPTRIWLSMPAMVALIGGSHTDSRHRRGIGGELCKEVDEVTSNVPFLAMLMGRQEGGALQSFQALGDEVKVLNAALAAGGAALWVARRGRGGGAAITSRPVAR